MQLDKICAAGTCKACHAKGGGDMTGANATRLLRVSDHIHDNPAGDLSLDALSDVAAMNRFNLPASSVR